jgi:hypothetical protein
LSSADPSTPAVTTEIAITKKDDPDTENARALRTLSTRFLLQLDALVETANRIMIITGRSRARAQEELNAFVEPRLGDDGKGSKLTLKSASPEFYEYQKLINATRKASEAMRLVPRSFLVSMVTQYDTFLGETVRRLFKLKPEKVRTAESSMKVKEIVKFTSIEDLLKQLIDDEIDDALRGSHTSQLEWIAKRFDITLDWKDQLLQKFTELTERRNAYVHSDGYINRQYINVCSALKDELVPERTLGKHLPLQRNYLEGARDTLFEVAMRTLQIAWRKQRQDQSDEQDIGLNEIIFDLLKREDYRLARNLADFAASLRNYASDRNKRMLTINRAQAYKWSGKEDEAIKIIDSLDWTSASANFKLVVALIRNDFSLAAKLINQVPSDIQDEDALPAEAYRSWPVFKLARKDETFLRAFQEKFKEPLVAEMVDVPSVQLPDEIGIVIPDELDKPDLPTTDQG